MPRRMPPRATASRVLVGALCVAIALVGAVAGESAADGSTCYDGCSGHGDCHAYTCRCHDGYDGEGCATRLVPEGMPIIPHLTAGHGNVTSAREYARLLRSTRRQGAPALLAASSRACAKCIVAENYYAEAAPALERLGVRLVRADAEAEALREVVAALGAADVPHVSLLRGGRAVAYTGPHAAADLVALAKKASGEAAPAVTTMAELCALVADPWAWAGEPDANGMPRWSVLVGVFRGAHEDSDEGEDWEEFLEAANELAPDPRIWVVHVDVASADTEAALVDAVLQRTGAAQHKKRKGSRPGILQRTPGALLFRLESAHAAATALDECSAAALKRAVGDSGSVMPLEAFYGAGLPLWQWARRESLPLVGHLTASSFATYEALQLPMLLLFLDLSEFDEARAAGGSSGGVPNHALLAAMRDVARDFSFHAPTRLGWDAGVANRIAFVFADGVAFADQMRALGLRGGRQHLPAMAFNVVDRRVLPFPADRPITATTVRHFCTEFLAGRLKDVSAPLAPAPRAMEEQVGVRELFHARDDVDVLPVTRDNYTRIALDETRDVLLLVHAADDADSMAVAPYYKRVGRRFRELGVASVVVARFDASKEAPPHELPLKALPLIVLLPAFDKAPPLRFYSGTAKVGPLMQWVAAHAGVPFALPELPQFDAEDAALFREQIVQREEARASRAEAAAAATDNAAQEPPLGQPAPPEEAGAQDSGDRKKTKAKKSKKKTKKKGKKGTKGEAAAAPTVDSAEL